MVDQINKDGKRMQVVVVSCDKHREEYESHVSSFPRSYFIVPFNARAVVERLEDMAEAANIPRISVFSTRKGFESFAVKDIKFSVMKSASTAEAITDVVNQLEQ